MEYFAGKSKDRANEAYPDVEASQFTDQASVQAKENNNMFYQTEFNGLQTCDTEMLSFPKKHTLPDNLLVHCAEYSNLKACPRENPALPTCKCRATIVKSFKCGGCFKAYSTICKLHDHLEQVHRDSDMFLFDKITKTAFPRYGSCCKVTQTDTEILSFGNVDVLERSAEENIDTDEDVKIPCNELADSAQDPDEQESSYFNEPKLFEKKIESLGVQTLSPDHVDDFTTQTHVAVKSEVHMTEDGNVSLVGKSRGLAKKKKRKRDRPFNMRRRKKKLKNVSVNKLQNSDIQNLKIDEKEESIKCKQCTSFFATIQCLQLHMEKDHGNKTYCEICDKVFSYPNALKRHAAIHERPTFYTCDKCGKTYSSCAKLKRHTSTIHPDEKNFLCDHCGEAFATVPLLRFHIRTCLNIRPFVCPRENCGRSYTSNGSLKVHMRNHTGETPYICEKCGKGFTRTGSLTCHMRMHTGERAFKCNQCSKAFAARSTLLRHMRNTHTQDKPLVCHCGKAFSNNWNLKAHMRQHTGEKPYSCYICGAEFTHNVSLKKHMKLH